MEGFVSEWESAVVHGDEDFCTEVSEGADSLLWIHVDIAAAGRLVGTDGHEGDIDVMAFADFREAIEVGAIAAMEDAFPTGFDDVAAVIAMGVVDVARAPMVAGRVDYIHAADIELVPDFHLVDGRETEFPHQRGTTHRHYDTLASLQDF